MQLPIGTVVRLKRELLGNPKGSLGVAYECYNIGKDKGTSFIFENGDYDGFSEDEQEMFLEKIGVCRTEIDYNFKNVMQLSKDYKEGFFDFDALKQKYKWNPNIKRRLR